MRSNSRAHLSAESSARRSLIDRAWSVALAVWGAITGVAPHVLHHVGPLAGAAILAGAAGQLVFAAIAVTASVPFLLRLRRRYGTWVAPAIAVTVMAVMFSLSSFVLGPAIRGDRSDRTPQMHHPTHEQHSP